MSEDRPVTAEELRALTKTARSKDAARVVAEALTYLDYSARDAANDGDFGCVFCRLHADQSFVDKVVLELTGVLAPRGLRIFAKDRGPSQELKCPGGTCFDLFVSWELPSV